MPRHRRSSVIMQERVVMLHQIARESRGSEPSRIGRPAGAAMGPSASGRDVPSGPWAVEDAYGYCEDFALARSEALPIVSRLVPVEIRPHLLALYAFTRS